jgi:hypothetical protein
MTIPAGATNYFNNGDVKKRYGIYNNGLERFVAISDDLWTIHHSAKLLSSKFSSTVCVISHPDITNDNCHLWGLSHHSAAKQDRQTPVLVIIDSAVEIKGFPDDTTEADFFSDKSYIQFLVKVTYALRLTDAICNTGDQHFYNKLFGEHNLTKIIDDSGIDSGFIPSVESILYFSANEAEAIDKFNIILLGENSSRPGQTSTYRNTFNSLLRNS